MKFKTTYLFVGGKKGKVTCVPFEYLEKGDYFYQENPDGEMCVSEKGTVIFRAQDNAKAIAPEGNYGITAEGIC